MKVPRETCSDPSSSDQEASVHSHRSAPWARRQRNCQNPGFASGTVPNPHAQSVQPEHPLAKLTFWVNALRAGVHPDMSGRLELDIAPVAVQIHRQRLPGLPVYSLLGSATGPAGRGLPPLFDSGQVPFDTNTTSPAQVAQASAPRPVQSPTSAATNAPSVARSAPKAAQEPKAHLARNQLEAGGQAVAMEDQAAAGVLQTVEAEVQAMEVGCPAAEPGPYPRVLLPHAPCLLGDGHDRTSEPLHRPEGPHPPAEDAVAGGDWPAGDGNCPTAPTDHSFGDGKEAALSVTGSESTDAGANVNAGTGALEGKRQADMTVLTNGTDHSPVPQLPLQPHLQPQLQEQQVLTKPEQQLQEQESLSKSRYSGSSYVHRLQEGLQEGLLQALRKRTAAQAGLYET